MVFAADVVAPGGPSLPVWSFLTAICLGIIGLFAQQIAAKKAANEAKIKAIEAAADSKQAVKNTQNVGNGFAGDVGKKLDSIVESNQRLEESFKGHLEWHLREGQK